MKQWKTVLVTAVIALLVAALILMAQKVFVSQDERATKARITQYKIVLEEQRLITEILTLKYDAALVRSKFNPVPDANTP